MLNPLSGYPISGYAYKNNSSYYYMQIQKITGSVALLAVVLTGCSGYVQMMPRDSGKVYQGAVQGSATGTGTMTIDIDGQTYTGPVLRTSSGDSFGFMQQYGKRGMVSTGTMASVGSTATVKAILSSPGGRGLRCEFTSDGSGGGGVCMDDQGRVLDALVSR